MTKKYTLKWRGTSYVRNITAKTLKEAKLLFCIMENVNADYSIKRVVEIKKPTFININQ